MRVAIVCPYDLSAPGGVQQIVLGLSAALADVGDDVTVVAPSSHPMADVVTVGGVVTVRGNASAVPISLHPAVMGEVARAVSGHEVVHLHEPFVPLVGWAGLRTDLPIVATFHADPARWTRRLYRMTAGFGARLLGRATITAVSDRAANALPPRWGDVRVIPNAIDVGSYRPNADRRSKSVAFLGRDDRRKGLDVLLAAWPAVRRAVPGAVLSVMGARRPDPPDGVEYLGRVGEETKRATLAESEVFVAPNLEGESFGIVLLEAMASGCRVIASDIAAFQAVLGDAGTLVPAGNAEALTAALVSILTGGAGENLERTAATRVAEFDWRAVAGRYRAAYAEAAGIR